MLDEPVFRFEAKVKILKSREQFQSDFGADGAG
jgi:hypothetical protein